MWTTSFGPGIGAARGGRRMPEVVVTAWGIKGGERMNPEAALCFPLPHMLHFSHNPSPFSFRGGCWPRQTVTFQPWGDKFSLARPAGKPWICSIRKASVLLVTFDGIALNSSNFAPTYFPCILFPFFFCSSMLFRLWHSSVLLFPPNQLSSFNTKSSFRMD